MKLGYHHPLRPLAYATYTPVLGSIAEMRDALRELSDAVDDLEGAIATERPTPEKVERATAAWDRIPELAERVEGALAPAKVQTLLRRIARMRGVKRDEFERRTGEHRFVRF